MYLPSLFTCVTYCVGVVPHNFFHNLFSYSTFLCSTHPSISPSFVPFFLFFLPLVSPLLCIFHKQLQPSMSIYPQLLTNGHQIHLMLLPCPIDQALVSRKAASSACRSLPLDKKDRVESHKLTNWLTELHCLGV